MIKGGLPAFIRPSPAEEQEELESLEGYREHRRQIKAENFS